MLGPQAREHGHRAGRRDAAVAVDVRDGPGLEHDLHWLIVGDGVEDISENELEIWYGSQDRFAMIGGVEAVVRLPAALWGLAAILVAFFLAREVYGSSSHGLMAALFLGEAAGWRVVLGAALVVAGAILIST